MLLAFDVQLFSNKSLLQPLLILAIALILPSPIQFSISLLFFTSLTSYVQFTFLHLCGILLFEEALQPQPQGEELSSPLPND